MPLLCCCCGGIGAWLSESVRNLVARRGKDSPYLFLCINPAYEGPNFPEVDRSYNQGWVIKMSFRMPKFANGLYRPWKVLGTGQQQEESEDQASSPRHCCLPA